MRKTINKTTVIIVLALFLTLSVGYALFSDTITIEGTATAQGNFDIEVTCLTTIPDDLKNSSDGALASEMSNKPDNGYKDESCIITDNKVEYSAGLEYPGASKYYAIKFTNVGSIDAKFRPYAIGEQQGKEEVKIYNLSDELISSEIVDSEFFSVSENGLHFQNKDGIFADKNNLTEEEMDYYVDLSNENEPYNLVRVGASIYLVLRAEWPTSDKYSEDGVYYKVKHTIELPFEQYNG